jgi:acetylornithine deacetylase/succinyl-diaminopimelate desuccinylase-like protein
MAEGTAAAQSRIVRLAALLPVHRAFHWLHLHQPQLLAWQREFNAIPAPTFAEEKRAEWFLDRFSALGLAEVHRDAAGNALGLLGPLEGPCVLLSAHLDTVFPLQTSCAVQEDAGRLRAPGICDNAAGLTGLLALAAALRYAGIEPPVGLLIAANVGEEGEGNLRGMRHLFASQPYGPRIAAAIALEGAGSNAVVTEALGSRRFRLTVSGPGGHSWSDAKMPNPILTLARMLVIVSAVALPDAPRTTLTPGMIGGGTSINSIPEQAWMTLDLRSASAECLSETESRLRAALSSVDVEGLTVTLDLVGDRPASKLPANAPLLATLRAVDRHLGLRTETRLGSTDANIPLSLGVPAIALGAGGIGGGIHTLNEWYEPTGREVALRRILLTLLDTAQLAVEAGAEKLGTLDR